MRNKKSTNRKQSQEKPLTLSKMAEYYEKAKKEGKNVIYLSSKEYDEYARMLSSCGGGLGFLLYLWGEILEAKPGKEREKALKDAIKKWEMYEKREKERKERKAVFYFKGMEVRWNQNK